MSTYAARAARPPARIYVSQTQLEPLDEKDGIRGHSAYLVYSIPHRIHEARVSRAHADALWVVAFTTVFPVRRYPYELYTHAMSAARDMVGRKAGLDLQTFSGAQRTYMGTQRCPRKVASGLCGQPPMPGTVWCEWHPRGEWRAPDA